MRFVRLVLAAAIGLFVALGAARSAHAKAKVEIVAVELTQGVTSDHAAWLVERLKADGYAKDLAYWKEKLGGAPRLLELPTDWRRPSVMAYAGAVVLGEVPAETYAALARLAIQEQTTPFVVLMAAFQTLLHRYSGQTDILVGSQPVAGRNHSDIEGLVGCFINTVVIRNEVRSEVSFQEHLREVRASVWEALCMRNSRSSDWWTN